jgi:hypothetical protein
VKSACDQMTATIGEEAKSEYQPCWSFLFICTFACTRRDRRRDLRRTMLDGCRGDALTTAEVPEYLYSCLVC